MTARGAGEGETAGGAPPAPAVTVAIVAYQSGAYLQPCVAALAAQTFADFEALILDNGSTDGATRALRLPDPRFRVVALGANLGFAAANNRAAELGRGAWLATLNPDTEAAPDWLAELMAATRRWPQADAFGSTQLLLSDPSRLDGVGDVWHAAGLPWRAGFGRPASAIPPEGEVFSPCAAAALYRRTRFLELGGFDPAFFCYCEDVDFGYRLRRAGGIAVQVPRAVVRHAGSGTSGRASAFSVFHGQRNRLWTFLKNTPSAWLPLLGPYAAALSGLRLLLAVPRGEAGVVLRAYAAALKGAPAAWRARRGLPRTAARGLARRMAWSPWSPWFRPIPRPPARARPAARARPPARD